jgi:hypothetical protein
VKKALPPILFFLTIALMIAGLAYRYYLNKTRVNTVKVGAMSLQIEPDAAKKIAAGSSILLKPKATAAVPATQTEGAAPSITVTTPSDEVAEIDAFMPIVITAFLGLVAVGLLIWRKGDADAQKWVYSTFGAILGYWLKGGA